MLEPRSMESMMHCGCNLWVRPSGCGIYLLHWWWLVPSVVGLDQHGPVLTRNKKWPFHPSHLLSVSSYSINSIYNRCQSLLYTHRTLKESNPGMLYGSCLSGLYTNISTSKPANRKVEAATAK